MGGAVGVAGCHGNRVRRGQPPAGTASCVPEGAVDGRVAGVAMTAASVRQRIDQCGIIALPIFWNVSWNMRLSLWDRLLRDGSFVFQNRRFYECAAATQI